jgi:hypothetical protein
MKSSLEIGGNMSAELELKLIDPGFLLGKGKAIISVLVDGQPAGKMGIGETNNMRLTSGEHTVYIKQRFGWITRNSNKVTITTSEAKKEVITGIYSRIWGKYKLYI